MKFGLGPYVPATADGGRGAFLRTLDDAAQAEACAFDSVWVSERHFSEYGACAASFPLAGAVAVRTVGVRIGVLCDVGLTHPAYIAEDAATLDNLSAGRLMLGARWPDEDAWAGYGVAPEEREGRFRESLEILQRAWAPQPFSFEGERFRVPARLPQNEFTHGQRELSFTPKPAQPTIPLWALVEDRDLAGLAADADAGLLFPPDLSLSALQPIVAAYRARRRPRPSDIVALIRHVVVARGRDEAVSRAAPALRAHYGRNPAPGGRSVDDAVEGAIEDWAIVGDVDTCIERIRRYRDELGVNYLICHMALPGLTAEWLRGAIELFGKAVISEFRMVNFPREIRRRFLEALT